MIELTPKEEKYIAILEKRGNHLEDRINNSPRDLSYDKAELAALDWAIDKLTGADQEEIPTVKIASNQV